MALNTIVVAKCAVCAQFVRSLLVTRRVAKCPHLRANCANYKQTAPTTSHLGHRKVTQFCRCPLYYVAFFIPTVFGIMSLFFTIYISFIFKPFLLLQSPFKHLFLLKSLVWPLPLRFFPTFIIFYIIFRPFIVPASSSFGFFDTT